MQLLEEIKDISLYNQDNQLINIKDFKDKKVLIYFFPKALTSACSLQAQKYQALIKEFKKLKVEVIAISKDSVKNLKKFSDKYNLTFNLLSDINLEVAKYFSAYGIKKLYGKEYYGIIRSTFLLDAKKRLCFQNYKVRAANDAEEMLTFIKNCK